jgi:hypothetical protein
LKRHWTRAAVLIGILAGAHVARAQDGPQRASWDPLPVAPSVAPGDAGSPVAPAGPVPGVGTIPAGLERLLSGPNAFRDGEHENVDPECPVLWMTVEGLLGWTKRAPLNAPLVTNSTDTTNSVGAIGQQGTVVVAGGNGLVANDLPGARLTFGLNLHEAGWWCLPVEFSVFYMQQTHTEFTAKSDDTGFPPLSRPIFATQGNLETVFISSFPNLAVGGINVSSATRLWGFEFNVLGMTGPLISDGACNHVRLELFGGYRYLDLSEDLQVFSTASPINSQFAVFFQGGTFGQGNTTLVNDVFRTHNYFSGAQLGARINWESGPLFINLETQAAIGSMEQSVNIYGTSSLVEPSGKVVTVPGGLLAVLSNGGLHHRSEFGFLPEAKLTLGVDITQNIRVHAGYDILYLNSVVRPGTQVSAAVDTRQVVTDLSFNPSVNAKDPRFQYHATDFWIQAVSVGVTFRY